MKKSLQERMDEFCRYHRDGDGECNAILLAEYARRWRLSQQERFDLSYFFSIVYCCESAIILFQNRNAVLKDPSTAAQQLKPEMIFQSDRKYMRMRNCFAKSLRFWAETLRNDVISKYVSDGVLDLNKALKQVQEWYMFGRFSAFLFLETYATVMGLDVTQISIDWKEGDTATSGLLNLFGDDAYANEFDQKGVLNVPVDKMDTRLLKVVSAVNKSGGEANVTKIETSLCAYRKFYKGTRYNGFYLDRMLEELTWYRKNHHEYNALTDELFAIRKKCFEWDLLGEKHGWNGIRKEEKKVYMRYGII